MRSHSCPCTEADHYIGPDPVLHCTGKRAYAERIADQDALKRDIALLQSEMHALQSSVANLDALKHETFALERELLHERAKVNMSCNAGALC